MGWETRAAAGARLVLTLAGLVVAAVLGLKILVSVLEPRATFFPVRSAGITPAVFGLPFEDLRIETRDGVSIHAWFIPAAAPPVGASAPPSPAPGHTARPLTLIAFHGNAESIEQTLPLARLVREAGFNLLAVEYRGYGRSGGRPSERGVYADGEAALRTLRARSDVASDRIVLWGRSIGAAVAVDVAANLAADEAVAGLILESPFTSAQDLLRDGGHWLLYGLSYFGSYRFDSGAKIARVASPVLVVHGTADEIAPFALGRRLFDRAPEGSGFLEIKGGGHNDLWEDHAGTLWDGMIRFLHGLAPDTVER